MICNSTVAKDQFSILVTFLQGYIKSDLNVCRSALGHCLVQLRVEGGDFITGDGGGVRAEEASGERGLCYGYLMGCHAGRVEGRGGGGPVVRWNEVGEASG